jgi:Type II secretion system (T2SS), protein F
VSELIHYPILLLLAGGLALGVFLLVSGQPLGQPGPDPLTRIRRLDPDLLWDEEETEGGSSSNVLGVLRPLRQDALRLVTFVSERMGLGLSSRQIELLEGVDSLADHYLQRLTTPLFYEALALLVSLVFNLLGIWHGLWPWWVWLAVCGVGFVMPHVLARGKLGRQREELLAGLPRLADLLAIAASGGAGIELAAQAVTPYLAGPLGREWVRMGQQLRRGGVGFPEALEELSARNQVPEMERLVELLIATYNSGTSVAPRLRQLAAGWREDRLRTLQADAGRAGETMFLPVMLGILVPLMVLVVAPGAAAYIRLLVS